MNEPTLDYPTAFRVQEQIGTASPPHHPKCSAHVEAGAFLCDCGVVEDHWKANKTDYDC